MKTHPLDKVCEGLAIGFKKELLWNWNPLNSKMPHFKGKSKAKKRLPIKLSSAEIAALL